MIRYNLKAALRNILRFKSHTVISLLGLVMGLACVFVISAWTIQELMYDTFHEQSEAIYMVKTDLQDKDGNFNSFPETPPPLANALEKQIPGIDAGFHFVYLYGGRPIKTDHFSFKETGIAADSKFLNVLNFPLKIGNPMALEEPNSILLTESLVEKLFPNEAPIGKNLRYGVDQELIVKGVLEDVPENSNLKFDYIISYQIESDKPDKWWQLSDATYIKLKSGADINEIKPLAEKIWKEHIKDDQYRISFIPIEDLRFKASFPFFDVEHGNIQKLYTFIFVAALILLLACLNYVNLISAHASKRTNDVAIRKINGANTPTLLGYFLTESIVMSFIAWCFAALLSRLVLQFFESVLDISIVVHYMNMSLVVGFFITLFVVGIVSGFYPAIVSSSVLPKKIGLLTSSNFGFQKKLQGAFVMSQFILSITLTIICLVIIRQTNFMLDYEVGFEHEHIAKVYLYKKDAKDFRALKNTLTAYPEIHEISFAGATPINLPTIVATGSWRWEGLNDGAHTSVYQLNVDEAYLKVFQIPLKEGNFFIGSENDTNKVVINEMLTAMMGIDDPVGRILKKGKHDYEIIGVVKDFHYQHLSNRIQPLLFLYSQSKNSMFVKTSDQPNKAIKLLQDENRKLGYEPLTYSFVSDKFDEMYKSERDISIGILVFTGLAILLSSIGLVGLVTFNTEMKTREIAVRKVYGAKTNQIVYMLNTGIMHWFVVSSFFSFMIAWFSMNKWLEKFAYSITLDWPIFAMGTAIIFIFTVLTVSLQTWRAAIKNPIDALKYE